MFRCPTVLVVRKTITVSQDFIKLLPTVLVRDPGEEQLLGRINGAADTSTVEALMSWVGFALFKYVMDWFVVSH